MSVPFWRRGCGAAKAKEKDQKAKIPTQSAMDALNWAELRQMISAASRLSRTMKKAVFKSEKADNLNGKPARLLTFDMQIAKLSEKQCQYLKKFEGSLDIWIAADGTPLASRMRQILSGRAFVVISFEDKNEDDSVYVLVGDRLLTMRKESKICGSGAGKKGKTRLSEPCICSRSRAIGPTAKGRIGRYGDNAKCPPEGGTFLSDKLFSKSATYPTKTSKTSITRGNRICRFHPARTFRPFDPVRYVNYYI